MATPGTRERVQMSEKSTAAMPTPLPSLEAIQAVNGS